MKSNSLYFAVFFFQRTLDVTVLYTLNFIIQTVHLHSSLIFSTSLSLIILHFLLRINVHCFLPLRYSNTSLMLLFNLLSDKLSRLNFLRLTVRNFPYLFMIYWPRSLPFLMLSCPCKTRAQNLMQCPRTGLINIT